MGPWVIDVGALVLIAIITYALASEGILGAGLMFFNVLFSGLIALNFYEAIATQIVANSSGIVAGLADCGSLMGLFVISLVIFRLTTDTLAPQMIRVPTPIYHLGRLAFALGTAFLATGIILIAFQASPVDKKVFGYLDYENKAPFGLGADRTWLSMMQGLSGRALSDGQPLVGPAPLEDSVYGAVRVFDPQGDWLIRTYEARIGQDDKLHVNGETDSSGDSASGADSNPGGASS